jgi:putative glutathione S-transferase
MGMMIEGRYLAEDPAPDTDADGVFRRKKATIRNWITLDGAPGPTGVGGFAADLSRYHLYAAWNCPWAHRALLVRAVKGLNLAVSYARPRRRCL